MKYFFFIFLILLLVTACVNTVKPAENKEASATVVEKQTIAEKPISAPPVTPAPTGENDYNIDDVFNEEEVEPPIIPA